MERYLEELESLKRRKWIADKENKEMKDLVIDFKDRIKKLKDDNRRFLKKIGECRDKERYQESLMADKDTTMREMKKEIDTKTRDFEGKD